MKFEKFVKILAISVMMVGSVFTFSQTTEAASTISIEKAAQKIYRAETKAYNTKKDVNVTVKVKCPAVASSKKAIEKAFDKVTDKIEVALVKKELGDDDIGTKIIGTHVNPAFGTFIYFMSGLRHSYRIGEFFYMTGSYSPSTDCADQTASWKDGVLTLKFHILGHKKWYRTQYKENTYLAKCVKELRELTDGMSKKEKAEAIDTWLFECEDEDLEDYDWYKDTGIGTDSQEGVRFTVIYSDKSLDWRGTMYSKIWKGTAVGDTVQQNEVRNLFLNLLKVEEKVY